jgi:GT2 family glycosyltransferase
LISVAVSYFNPTASDRLRAMVTFALECLTAYTRSPVELLVMDGSGKVDEALSRTCETRGWPYHPSTEVESFGRTYNRGAELARGDHVVLMASDIFVCQDWDQKLLSEMARTGAWMAAPFLSISDYPVQCRDYPVRRCTFHPSFMTFNLNVITRACMERVGLMDEKLSGGYNDIDYLLRIRGEGGTVIMVDAGPITHLGRATLSVQTKMTSEGVDFEYLRAKYPKLRDSDPHGLFDWRHPLLMGSRAYATLMRLCVKFGGVPFLRRFEPMFHRAV